MSAKRLLKKLVLKLANYVHDILRALILSVDSLVPPDENRESLEKGTLSSCN